jgi:Tfp pilus assembly protein PilN
MRAVNLLPRDERRGSSQQLQQNPATIGGVAGGLLVTIILAVWFLTASGGAAHNQKRLDAVKAELAATPIPPPTSPGASQIEQEKNSRVAALSTVLSTRLAWDRVFREISLVLPEDVWLTSLSAQSPTASGGTAAAVFTINGRTYSHDAVARLLTRLSLVPHLSSVSLQHSSSTDSDTGRKIVEFTINAAVNAPGGA